MTGIDRDAGDDCPNCRRGSLTKARPVKPFRLICPRCATSYR